MFQVIRTKTQNWHATLVFIRHVHWIAVTLFLYINSTLANTGTVKEDLYEKNNDSDIQLISNISPTPKPELILLLGGNIVEMEGPHVRPSIEEALPVSSSTLGGLLSKEANLFIKREINLTLKKNETLADILKRAKFSSNESYQIAEVVSKKINVRKLGIGMSFIIGFDDFNQPVALKTNQSEKLDYFIFKSQFGSWKGLQAIRPIESEFVHAAGIIDDTLYEAALDSNVPLSALDNFMRVMGFSVDFQRQLQRGDAFELVYNKSTDRITGETLSVGDVHYVGMVLSGKKIGYYRHQNTDGSLGWYDKNGKSAVRTLMRTPVNGARLSSSYGMRKHPISGYNKLHKGVDFAVPTGTPILAAGSGRIEMAGWNGNYGRYIRIRHNNTYQTAYAHLSAIAKGVYAGSQVDQGQIIGYVGSSGRSTGPHLHYEILVNRQQVNPMTINLPTGKNLSDIDRDSFQNTIQNLNEYITNNNDIQSYAGATLK